MSFQICEAVYLTLMVVVSHEGSQEASSLSSSVPCISSSGRPTADARSRQSFRAGKVGGRYGHTADEVASMELIWSRGVGRRGVARDSVAQTGWVGGALRRSGRFTKRWWRQHLRRRRSCRRERWHPRQRQQQSRQHQHRRQHHQKRHHLARPRHQHLLRHRKHHLRM